MATVLIGNEELNNKPERTQVYLTTHREDGTRLPYIHRSFISFTYGGKFIEDFGLISTTQDRLSKKAYANFEDFINDYATLNGQFYWGTHYKNNELNLTLSTDEITQNQIDEFKAWFSAGVERELILAEHPNRAIRARVAEPPQINLIPFEKKISFKINGLSYNTSTTLYKGDIELHFTMDEPHWYSKLNYVPSYIDKDTLTALTVEDENKVESLSDEDMLKILIEDGIPYQDQLTMDMFLGNYTLVVQEARVDFAKVGNSYVGIITGESSGLNVKNDKNAYLFYSGNAVDYPIIQFDLTPKFEWSNYIKMYYGKTEEWSQRLLKCPKNKKYNNTDEYSWIQIGSKKFEFTTPSILTGFHQAIYIFKYYPDTASFAEIKQLITEGVNEYYSRAWAIACINKMSTMTYPEKIDNNGTLVPTGVNLPIGNGSFTTGYPGNPIRMGLLNLMLLFLIDSQMPAITLNFDNLSKDGKDSTGLLYNLYTNYRYLNSEEIANNPNVEPIIDNSYTPAIVYPATFSFNSKTGEAICKFKIRVLQDQDGDIENAQFQTITQNVGDMVRSDYITIEGKDTFDENGAITSSNCKVISSNENLKNVLVFYKNMYL